MTCNTGAMKDNQAAWSDGPPVKDDSDSDTDNEVDEVMAGRGRSRGPRSKSP